MRGRVEKVIISLLCSRNRIPYLERRSWSTLYNDEILCSCCDFWFVCLLPGTSCWGKQVKKFSFVTFKFLELYILKFSMALIIYAFNSDVILCISLNLSFISGKKDSLALIALSLLWSVLIKWPKVFVTNPRHVRFNLWWDPLRTLCF